MRPMSIWMAVLFLLIVTSVLLFILLNTRSRFHRTRSELIQLKSLHNLIMDNSRDAIILGDLDGTRTYISPGVRAMTGWEPKALAGRLFRETIHPADVVEVDL